MALCSLPRVGSTSPMESSDSIDKTWDTTSDLTATTALRADPLASEDASASSSGGWMVNVAGRDIVEMAQANVIAKWRKRELSPSTLVWREGMDSWAKLESVPAFEMLAKSVEEEEEPGSTKKRTWSRSTSALWRRSCSTKLSRTNGSLHPRRVNLRPASAARSPRRARVGERPTRGAELSNARSAEKCFRTSRRAAPAPPLPPRRSAAPQHTSRPPMPTIPGGLAPPAPPSTPAVQASAPSPFPSAPPAGALRSSATPARRFPLSGTPTKSASVCRPHSRRARRPRPRPVRRRARCSPRSRRRHRTRVPSSSRPQRQRLLQHPNRPRRTSTKRAFWRGFRGRKRFLCGTPRWPAQARLSSPRS